MQKASSEEPAQYLEERPRQTWVKPVRQAIRRQIGRRRRDRIVRPEECGTVGGAGYMGANDSAQSFGSEGDDPQAKGLNLQAFLFSAGSGWNRRYKVGT